MTKPGDIVGAFNEGTSCKFTFRDAYGLDQERAAQVLGGAFPGVDLAVGLKGWHENAEKVASSNPQLAGLFANHLGILPAREGDAIFHYMDVCGPKQHPNNNTETGILVAVQRQNFRTADDLKKFVEADNRSLAGHYGLDKNGQPNVKSALDGVPFSGPGAYITNVLEIEKDHAQTHVRRVHYPYAYLTEKDPKKLAFHPSSIGLPTDLAQQVATTPRADDMRRYLPGGGPAGSLDLGKVLGGIFGGGQPQPSAPPAAPAYPAQSGSRQPVPVDRNPPLPPAQPQSPAGQVDTGGLKKGLGDAGAAIGDTARKAGAAIGGAFGNAGDWLVEQKQKADEIAAECRKNPDGDRCPKKPENGLY